MNEFFALVQQVLTIFGQYMSIPAVIAGAGVILLIRRLVPSSDPNDALSTVPGALSTRLLPLVGPAVAIIACVAIEWDKQFTATDFVRGVNSGIGSEFVLRLYFKSVVGK